MPHENPVNMNFGCGLSTAEDWLDFEASPTLRLSKIPVLGAIAQRKVQFPKEDVYGDVASGLPLKSGSADRVYCSHVLEHLSHDDCRRRSRKPIGS